VGAEPWTAGGVAVTEISRDLAQALVESMGTDNAWQFYAKTIALPYRIDKSAA